MITSSKNTATWVRTETGLAHGCRLDDLRDYGYELRRNRNAWAFDLVVVIDEIEPENIGKVYENEARCLKATCPECGEANYQVYFSESDYSGMWCNNCNKGYEFEDVKGGPKIRTRRIR